MVTSMYRFRDYFLRCSKQGREIMFKEYLNMGMPKYQVLWALSVDGSLIRFIQNPTKEMYEASMQGRTRNE